MKTITKVRIAKLIFNLLIFFGFNKKIITKKKSIIWNLDLSEGIDLSIFLFGSFQQEVVNSIYNYIFKFKKNKDNFFNIIDIGSNIGDKSLSITNKLLNKHISNFKVFSIEPTEYAYKKQIININLNPILKKKISSFQHFVSNKKSKPKKIYSSWSLESKKNFHKTHMGVLKDVKKSTKNISLDDFIKKHKIKKQIILKIDVDGFEMNVLKSCIKTLKEKNPIIFMEYAPYSFLENGSSVKEFNSFIKTHNYKIFDLDFNKLNKIKIAKGSSTDIILIKNKVF